MRWAAGELWRIGALVASALVISWRAPSLLLRPRFWAEEGSIYFAFAYCHAHTSSWYQALIFDFRGYFALWPNLVTTVAANVAPLERAPLVTTLFAFAVQLIPIGIIVWSRSDFWRSPTRKTLGVLIALFAPLSGELWLNTINSQFYFSLIAFLLLLEGAPATPGRSWLGRILLALGGLTGPVSCFLTPLFVARLWFERRREGLVQAVILAACSLIQLVSITRVSALGDRAADFVLETLPPIVWVQSVGMVLLGLGGSRELAETLAALRERGLYGVGALLLLAGTLATLWGLAARLPKPHRVYLLGSYLLLILVPLLGRPAIWGLMASRVGYGQRYFLVPNMVFLLLIAANVSTNDGRHRVRSAVCAMLVLWSLYLALLTFRQVGIVHPSWPDWREEVATWREDPRHELRS